MRYISLFITLILGGFLPVFSQTAQLKGVVLNQDEMPIVNALVEFENIQVQTNEYGFYVLEVAADKSIGVRFSHMSYQTAVLDLLLKKGEDRELNILLVPSNEVLREILIQKDYENKSGAVVISPQLLRKIPGANAGVENILKTLPGVYSNNELSTQYAVRGGNYDENLVYVNGIEVYKPFLIRSGQQEGVSFVNSDMIDNISFSAGGFQAKYGDKMASVLDITYRTPKSFKGALEASFLGGAATVDLVSKDQKWTSITSVRYRNNKMLVNSQETETEFSPRFVDLQSIVNFVPSARWQWSFLGNISGNTYQYKPLTRQTNFGTIDDAAALLVFYEGQEKDQYRTFFGALKSDFKLDENNTLTWITSAYQTQESEYYDILAQYRLGELDTAIGSDNFGSVSFSRGIGSQLNHARNDYDALIFNTEVKGIHTLDDHIIDWGLKYTHENIRDRLVEWEVIDSTGFAIPGPQFNIHNEQPYKSNEGPLLPYQNVRATHLPTIDRLQAFLQWSYKTEWNDAEIWLNAGVRFHQWQLKEEAENSGLKMIFSPRFQMAIKPNWDADMLFRMALGMYQQPPSYREYRAMDGNLNFDLKAQRSVHFVVGNDYSFTMWERPFKLMTELYYKDLSNVNTYTVDNVRIRYEADNDATAYVYGFDLRLYGSFVPGAESWLSFGYLKTEENYHNQGYRARPTDQRLKFGLLFQDYMPAIPNLKMYLNLVYNTGLPGGSPAYADPYIYQNRLRDYGRGDAGFSYVFKDETLGRNKKWLNKVEELQLGFEIFNLFDNQNAITNTWVRDVYSKREFGIPNYMTSRTFNLKLNVKW